MSSNENQKGEQIEDNEESEGEDESEGEYEEESGESDEDDEEDDKEPQLKYRRLGGSLRAIFSHGNKATAFCVGRKFLALGTDQGYLFVLDFDGNTNKQHQYQEHKGKINEISIDDREEYIATCSNDGKVIIRSLFNSNVKYVFTYLGPIYSVCLDPQFGLKNLPFFCGGKDGQLIYSRKGYFRSKESIINEKNEGVIYSIKWKHHFVAWCSAESIKIMDISTKKRITQVKKTPNSGFPADYRCCMVWVERENLELIVGWGNTLNILSIKAKPKINKNQLLEYFCVIKPIKVDYWICGVGPYKSDQLMILSYEETKEEQNPKPELRIISAPPELEELSIDTLMVKNFEKYKPIQYNLAFSEEHGDYVYYVISEIDIIVAQPRNVDDNIKWLLRAGKYEKALFTGKKRESELKLFSVKHLGEVYLTNLIKNKQYEKASLLVPKIAGKSKDIWEEWIYKFMTRKDNLKYIIPHIPLTEPQLCEDIYNMVLKYFLERDHNQLVISIKEWPVGIYNIDKITNLIEDVLSNIDSSSDKENPVAFSDDLYSALSKLYVYKKQFEKAVSILFKLRVITIFEFIKENNLIKFLQGRILELLDFNALKTIHLLIEYVNDIKVEDVVQQLKDNNKERELLKYFDAVWEANQNETEKYNLFHLELLCKYNPKNLRYFFEKTQTSYKIDDALDKCKEFHEKEENVENRKYLFRSVIYLSQRGGSPSDAVDLIINKLKEEIYNFQEGQTQKLSETQLKDMIKEDMELAFNVVESAEDDDLWAELIEKTISDPMLIGDLLKNISNYVGIYIDPVDLISKIPSGMKIDTLKSKIISIMTKFSLQLDLQNGVKDILNQDLKILCLEFFKQQRKGVNFAPTTQICEICQDESRSNIPVRFFFCGHCFHVQCYDDKFRAMKKRSNTMFCFRCYKKKKIR